MLKIREGKVKRCRRGRKAMDKKREGRAHKVGAQKDPRDKSCTRRRPHSHSGFIQRRLCKNPGGSQQGLEGRAMRSMGTNNPVQSVLLLPALESTSLWHFGVLRMLGCER